MIKNVQWSLCRAPVILQGAAIAQYSDSLRDGRSGDRIPVEARFSIPVQTGSVAHPPSYTMGAWYFLGVNRPGRGVETPPPSSAEVEGRVELYMCFLSGSSRPALGWTLPTFCQILMIDFQKIHIKFRENPSSERWVVPREQTDEETNMRKLIVGSAILRTRLTKEFVHTTKQLKKTSSFDHIWS
jgi:hypothetical protein